MAAVAAKAESTEAKRTAKVRREKVISINSLLITELSRSARSGQRKTENVTTGGNRYILFSGYCVAHGGRAHILPSIEVPQRFATSCVCGLKRAGVVPEKDQAASGCHRPARGATGTYLRIFPGNRICVQVEGDQKLLRSFARNTFYSGRVIALTFLESLRFEKIGFAFLQRHEIDGMTGLAVRGREPVGRSRVAGASPCTLRCRLDPGSSGPSLRIDSARPIQLFNERNC